MTKEVPILCAAAAILAFLSVKVAGYSARSDLIGQSGKMGPMIERVTKMLLEEVETLC